LTDKPLPLLPCPEQRNAPFLPAARETGFPGLLSVRVGNTIFTEKLSYKGWQKRYGSAFLAAYLDPADFTPSCARYAQYWEGAGVGGEARLRTAYERLVQRAKEGQVLPRSFGIPRAGARLSQSPSEPPLEPAFLLRHGRLEAWTGRSEPPVLEPGEHSALT
jgi:hypothetical protein